MTATQLILVIAIAVAVVTALLAAQRGPRVTEITRTVERGDGKDDDDA